MRDADVFYPEVIVNKCWKMAAAPLRNRAVCDWSSDSKRGNAGGARSGQVEQVEQIDGVRWSR